MPPAGSSLAALIRFWIRGLPGDCLDLRHSLPDFALPDGIVQLHPFFPVSAIAFAANLGWSPYSITIPGGESRTCIPIMSGSLQSIAGGLPVRRRRH